MILYDLMIGGVAVETRAYPEPPPSLREGDGLLVEVTDPARLAPPPVRTRTPLEFEQEEFTEAERSAIDMAAMSDLDVFRWRLRFAAATVIDKDDPRTGEGLEMLVGKGLLTAQRKAEILA